MAFKATHKYSKDPQTVLKMLVDQTYMEKKFEALGATNIKFLECGVSGGQHVLKTNRVVPTNPPGFAKKILGTTNTLDEVDTWEDTDADTVKGTFEVDVQGAPIKISGTMVLTPDGGGCVNTITGEAKVSVPLVGGKIAKFVEGDTEKGLADDYAFTSKYLDSL